MQQTLGCAVSPVPRSCFLARQDRSRAGFAGGPSGGPSPAVTEGALSRRRFAEKHGAARAGGSP